MFRSIDIKGFRGFGALRIEELGRVNLVVGKNNTGKTSLLEAMSLVADYRQFAQLGGLFRTTHGQVDELCYRWLIADRARTAELSAELTDGQGQVGFLWLATDDNDPLPGGRLEILSRHGATALWGKPSQEVTGVHAVSVQHRGPDSMVDAFAEAVRSPADERQLEALLAAVDPRIKSVRLDAVQSKPFIVVDVGLGARVPLSQAGQGIYRLVGIFSELLGSKPKIFLIDEIENGIHYSALPSVWKGIAEVAARLDIQVFATTHSWECVEAAHEAFATRDSYDLRLIQLYRVNDETTGRVLDQKHIEAAIAGEIEVR